MRTIKILLAVCAAMAAQAPLAGAQGLPLNFDGRRGAAGAASLKELLQAAAPEIPAAKIMPAEADKGYGKWNSCQIVELDNRDGAYISRNVDLSREYPRQVCENVYITNSAGQSATVSQCHSEMVFYSGTANLVINSRELRTGEKERIEVCYDFMSRKGSLMVLQSPFDYTYRDKTGDGWYSLELFPGARKPQAPAAGALELGGFAYDDIRGEFTLTLRNRFGGDYAGRKVHIGVELVQDKFFDSSLGTKFFEFPVSQYGGDFRLTFRQGDFSSAKAAEDFRAKAKNYFVNWGFKVKGEGFTDAYVEGGRTGAVQITQ